MMNHDWLARVNTERLVRDTLGLVRVPSPTGNTEQVADVYEAMLREAGCRVERHTFIPGNPTLVAVYDQGRPGRTVLFNGHMDTIPLAHEPAELRGGRIYGRGSNDMKGSLACFAEVVRVLRESETPLDGRLVLVANSLHESPGGRGEDLDALAASAPPKADAAIVMEGATRDCTVAQLGSATFEITIRREGEPSHQLYTPPGTPHPITIAAEVVQTLNSLNEELGKTYIEDIGYASYFIGSIRSGQFYNQFPVTAELEGVRRYSPETTFEEVEAELRGRLERMAHAYGAVIDVKLEKVRDGYRIRKDEPAVQALTEAVRKVREIPLPPVGKQLVTDAAIFVRRLGIPTLCHGPDQRTAHGDVEYVEIEELVLATKVYLQFLAEFLTEPSRNAASASANAAGEGGRS